MPLSSTIRTDGMPSGVAVASAIASGSGRPAATASSYHARNWASGVAHIAIATYLVSRYSWMPSAPALAAEAGRLDAAERRRGVGDEPLVEADHAGLELLADAERPLDVVRVDVGDEPVLGVVGGRDRGLLVVEADDRRDRAEDLLLEQPRVRRARRPARSARRSSRRRRAWPPPTSDLRALGRRVLDQLGDLLALRRVDQRADLDAVLGAAADLHRAQLGGQLLGELVARPRRRRGSGWRPCRPRRCCASWRSSRPRPRRRRRRRRRPGTARCRRAPSRCAAGPRPTARRACGRPPSSR